MEFLTQFWSRHSDPISICWLQRFFFAFDNSTYGFWQYSSLLRITDGLWFIVRCQHQLWKYDCSFLQNCSARPLGREELSGPSISSLSRKFRGTRKLEKYWNICTKLKLNLEWNQVYACFLIRHVMLISR